MRWRNGEDGFPPSARFISSPYDPEAHYAKKRTTSWVGYKVHLTETCEEGAPHLITHVETTPASLADGEMTTRIHDALAQKSLLPSTHLVDTGYVDGPLLAASQRNYEVELRRAVWPLASIAASRVAFPSTGDRVGALNENFRSSIAPPTDALIYASSLASRRRHLQDSGSGWSRFLLSCRALASPATCLLFRNLHPLRAPPDSRPLVI